MNTVHWVLSWEFHVIDSKCRTRTKQITIEYPEIDADGIIIISFDGL